MIKAFSPFAFLGSFFRMLQSGIDEAGATLLFVKKILICLVRREFSLSLVIEQIWRVTVQSLPTIMMAGFFVGAIMSIQFAMQVQSFGAMGYLGGMVTSVNFREVGPLLIAFMLSGKVGAFTSAELGTMRVTEQIDAILCLGADPIREIILPRFMGIVISSFFLLLMGLLMSIVGGMILGMLFTGLSMEEYLRHIPTILHFSSILSGLIKCFFFSLVLASICTYKGYTASGGARGVGLAVVSTAVTTMVGMVFFDWLSSFLWQKTLLFWLEM